MKCLECTLKFWKGEYDVVNLHCSIQALYIYAAHELRAWLLHYSPIVLYEILPDTFYQHYLLFVEGIFLLLKDSVCEADVRKSELLLNHFCFLFSSYYG